MSEALTYDDVLLVPSYNHWESRKVVDTNITCLLYTSPSPRDQRGSRMPSSA